VANGGVLVIDDFGRQKCSPTELLNRWIVPLETRKDFLMLQTGQMFEVPFVVFVIFASNIRPSELGDEAFFRRIQYKILAESPTVDDYLRIFDNYCRQQQVPFDRSVVEHMFDHYYRSHKVQLRGCQPRDLIDHALSMARYLGQPRKLTPSLLEAACESYFVVDEEPPSVYA
jgi:SpoVK/Ycf46/Vps4 family AAA+-type ATPase